MPREGVVAEGLELEAALAAEEAWRLREAIASMDRSHDMDVDSPRLLATELGGDGSTVDPNKAIPDGEQQTLEVPIRRSCEDSSERLSRLFATQKRLMEATKDQLPSQARKRMRSASAANTSNTVHDIQSASSPTPVSPVSPVHKRNKRTSSKRSLVWKHFNTGLRGQHPVATCVYCGQEYMCNSSTHGTSTLWNHLRILCPQQPFKDHGRGVKGVCKDWQGVVLNNKFLHVRCCAHIVNLIVKSGLEEHNESIDKIRTAVKFVRSSSSRLNIFKKCAELEKISNKGLLNLDLETRWNSTFLMLEGAEKFEKAFTRLQKDYKPFKAYFPNKDPPDAYDWRTARRILCFLKLFEKVTTRLSASLHVTSSIVFHDIMLMRAKLIEIVGGEDQILSSMANHMKLKFQKYWEEEGNLNYLLFIAVILDPRYKLEYLKFCLDILYGPDEGKELSEKIESALDELFSSYAKTVNTSSSNIASKHTRRLEKSFFQRIAQITNIALEI